MRLLLDTCVVSELRRSKCDPKVRTAILRFADDDLFLSVLTIGEIAKGISLSKDHRRQNQLAAWLDKLSLQFGERVLPVDPATAEIWGHLTAKAARQSEVIPAVDGLIAATALRHGLAVATRNQRHFQLAGVRVFDPWTGVAG